MAQPPGRRRSGTLSSGCLAAASWRGRTLRHVSSGVAWAGLPCAGVAAWPGPRVRCSWRGLRRPIKSNTLAWVEFSWDERKAASNLKKHGVSFEEAATVFADPLAFAIDDVLDPERTLLLGLSNRQRILLVVHAELYDSSIRIISARRATSHERRRYEEEGH